MTDQDGKLLDLLLRALNDLGASSFQYEWDWEYALVPEHFIIINDTDIIERYGIDFDFGELDLDRLVTAGYFEKTTLVNTDTDVVIVYKLLPDPPATN